MILVLAPVAFIVLFTVVRLFARSFLAGWYALLIVSALGYAVGADSARFAGIHIFPSDALYFCLLAAGAIRSRVWELRFSPLSLTVMAYVGIFVLSMTRGLLQFEVTTVGPEARGFIGEIVAVIYFITVPHDREVIRKVVRAMILFAAFLVLIVVLHYAGLPVGVDMTLDPTIKIDRALQATAVGSIELALIFAAFWWTWEERGSRWMFVATVVFTTCVVGLQHRTVWGMLAVTLAMALFIDRDVLRVFLKALGLTAVAGLLVLVISPGLRSRLVADLQESATNSGTLTWRVQSSQRSIEQEEGLIEVLIGQPMGSGYSRLDIDTGTYTTAPPHDELVNQYVRLGLVGTLLLLAILLRPIWAVWRGGDDDLLFPGANAWLIVAAAVFTFGIPYCFSAEIVAFAAMANGLTSDEFALEQESDFLDEDSEDRPVDDPIDPTLEPLPQL